MEIPYYPGCTLNTKGKGFDNSARASARALGLELVELEEWNCCGATFPLLVDNMLDLAGPAQVLQLVLADVGSRLPFGSLSLAATSMDTAVSCGVLALSSLADGGLLIGGPEAPGRMDMPPNAQWSLAPSEALMVT